MFSLLITWARTNERRLSTLLFIGGFATDVIAFTIIDLPVVNLLFLGYLGLATVLIAISFVWGDWFRNSRTLWHRSVAVLAPLGAQFVIGGLLSGCLIFYTKSATLSVSWPFLLLLLVVFLGNEYFRDYRSYLIFQVTLFYFALYAYLIFALPLYLERLSPLIFLASTATALILLAVFLFVLSLFSRRRMARSAPRIALGALGITLAVVALYWSGLVPPIPLALKEAVVVQRVERVESGYRITRQPSSFQLPWEIPAVAQVPGMPLYAFTAVFAPGGFSAGIVHRWQRYDPSAGVWHTESVVTFSVAGGRSGGYRGYTIKNNPAPGQWRVAVETTEGQTLGRIGFEVVAVVSLPPLVTEIR